MKNWVLITGATGGIGQELAIVFAKNNYNLVLHGQNMDNVINFSTKLQQEYAVQTYCIAKDLSDVISCTEIYDELKTNNINISILVNNAGFGDYGPFSECDLGKNQKMINLNILAVITMTKLFLTDMLSEGYGKILNVASTAAFQPGPLMSVYYASKAFVLSFSEALSKELEKTDVTLSVLCPGPTESNFFEYAGAGHSRILKALKPAKAAHVASFAYKALMRNKVVAIHGARNKTLIFAERFASRKLVRNIINNIQKQKIIFKK